MAVMNMPLLRRAHDAARRAARLLALSAAIVLAGCGAPHYGSPSPAVDAVESHASRQGEAPESLARLDVATIRYSQASYSVTGHTEDGGSYSVQDSIQWLREHPVEDLPWGGSIRIFRKQAYMDKWGLGVLNPIMGKDAGVLGQVLVDGKHGGEYLRLEFPQAFRLTYLIFAQVGINDDFDLLADGNLIDLDALDAVR